MLKSNRREAMIFLLGGLAALGGSNLTQGKQASIPGDCRWLALPYLFADLNKILGEMEGPIRPSKPSVSVCAEEGYPSSMCSDSQ